MGTYVSLPEVELGGSKHWYVSNIISYWEGKVDSLLALTLPKLSTTSENGSNKSSWVLNSV